jgi:oligopeptide/dipeptide ABC transporter ATP-binding protein
MTATNLTASSEPAATAYSIVRVTDLKTHFPVRSRGLLPRTVGYVKAVDGIDIAINAGETLGLVGESGSGKTTAARSILMLVKPTAGSIELDGLDVTKLSMKQLVPVRRKAAMIFQDPYNALNPRHTVGTIISAPFEVQKIKPDGGVKKSVQEIMERVGLNPEHYNRYPNEFSGGQRQRIGIARALALQPKLLVADEPVSALDVSIQAQVVNLLQDVQREFGIAFLFIAHDLAVVRHFCPEIAVMYLGKIVEIGDRETLYNRPHHPYTQALLSAAPDVKQAAVGGRRERIRLEGDVPSPINPPSGCRFRTRCWMAQDICAKVEPPLLQIGKTHKVACHFASPLGEAPTSPITLSALGVDRDGNPVPGAGHSAEDLQAPGYADEWTDLSAHSAASSRINEDNPTGTTNRPSTGSGGASTAPPDRNG